jgi:hypothetical protein
MAFVITCGECGKRLRFPDELYDQKVRGRVVTIGCRHCGKDITVDGTQPRDDSAPAPLDAWTVRPEGFTRSAAESAKPAQAVPPAAKPSPVEPGPTAPTRKSSPPPETNRKGDDPPAAASAAEPTAPSKGLPPVAAEQVPGAAPDLALALALAPRLAAARPNGEARNPTSAQDGLAPRAVAPQAPAMAARSAGSPPVGLKGGRQAASVDKPDDRRSSPEVRTSPRLAPDRTDSRGITQRRPTDREVDKLDESWGEIGPKPAPPRPKTDRTRRGERPTPLPQQRDSEPPNGQSRRSSPPAERQSAPGSAPRAVDEPEPPAAHEQPTPADTGANSSPAEAAKKPAVEIADRDSETAASADRSTDSTGRSEAESTSVPVDVAASQSSTAGARPSPPVAADPASVPQKMPATSAPAERSGANSSALWIAAAVIFGVAVLALLLPRRALLTVTATGPSGESLQAASVTVDGQLKCAKSPCSVSGLAAGDHSIRVTTDGFGSAERVVSVRSGLDHTVTFSLAAPCQRSAPVVSDEPGRSPAMVGSAGPR